MTAAIFALIVGGVIAVGALAAWWVWPYSTETSE